MQPHEGLHGSVLLCISHSFIAFSDWASTSAAPSLMRPGDCSDPPTMSFLGIFMGGIAEGKGSGALMAKGGRCP